VADSSSSGGGARRARAWSRMICAGRRKAKHAALDAQAQLAIRARQGRPLFGVEMKIVDDVGRELPNDGQSIGELLVRGPWIVGAYYEDEEATLAAVEPDGWCTALGFWDTGLKPTPPERAFEAVADDTQPG
jgi:acyl-CoA synthetase (AMP-forming)/AMP-acid ligase II